MKKLLALVVLGVAVKLFLDSESGKEIKRHLQDWLAEAQDILGDTLDTAKADLEKETPKMS
jgi:hypothetical protein